MENLERMTEEEKIEFIIHLQQRINTLEDMEQKHAQKMVAHGKQKEKTAVIVMEKRNKELKKDADLANSKLAGVEAKHIRESKSKDDQHAEKVEKLEQRIAELERAVPKIIRG